MEWVQYPNDTASARTSYTYDQLNRMVSAATVTTGGTRLTANYTYTNDLLTKLQTGSTTYNFSYGNFDLRSNIKIGSTSLASYSYTSRTHYLSSLTYGNADKVTYTYDQQGRVMKETYEDGDTVAYAYDNSGALATVTDSATGRTDTYYYDFTDRLMKYTESGTDYAHSVSYGYNVENMLTKIVETVNGADRSYTYGYNEDNRIDHIFDDLTVDGTAYNTIWMCGYDEYGRLQLSASYPFMMKYSYGTTADGKPTSQVTEMDLQPYTDSYKFLYDYDANGNITLATIGTNKARYTYDSANQLTREDNQAAGKTWVWTYDDAGNILTKKEYSYTEGTLGSVLSTVSYTYDTTWGDLLKTWNGKTIQSDAIGNMTSDGTWSYTWEHGRELTSMSKTGANWSFTYDANGMRTKRTNGSTTYSYVYNGSQLSYMGVGNNELYFSYDGLGNPMKVLYNGTQYHYVTNLQGDVLRILDEDMNTVVEYTYDAWGNLISTTGTLASTLGTHNPLRYRGYVYDTETGLYYLQSRYYNPAMGRFICADAFAATGQGVLGNNMFAYCNNNPTNYFDPYGNLPSPAHAVNELFEGSGVSADFEEYLRLIDSYKANGITLYHSIEGALSAWSEIYLPLSQDHEYVTYLYKLNTHMGPRFFVSQTYKGTKKAGPVSANVILGTVLLELQDAFYYTELVAHVHTHPNPGAGMHNDFPSADKGLSGGDRWIYNLLNLPEMYIIPYKRCSMTPQIIVYGDSNTWCPNYKPNS